MKAVLLVVGCTLAGCGDDSSGTPAGTLAAPSMLRVEAVTGGARLTWKDNSSDEEHFMFMRRKGSDAYMTLSATAPANATEFLDTGLVPGASYTYMVHGMRGSVLSDPSNEVTVQIPGGQGGAGAGGAGAGGAGAGGAGAGGAGAGGAGAGGAGAGGAGAGGAGAGGAGAGVARIGDACTTAGDCPSASAGTAACLTTGHPGGYCSIDGCNQHANDCPGGAECVVDPTPRCRATCAGATCRTGYSCAVRPTGHASAMVCVPS